MSCHAGILALTLLTATETVLAQQSGFEPITGPVFPNRTSVTQSRDIIPAGFLGQAEMRPSAPQLQPQQPRTPGSEAQLPPAVSPQPPQETGPFGPGQSVLPMLGGPSAGTTPHPSPAVQKEFEEFVSGTIDPEKTFDLMVGRPRVLILNAQPFRVQIADDRIASDTIISQTEISVVGNQVGSTVLNLWFLDPQGGRPHVLSYLVRVVPDPEQKERLERVYKALEKEINKAFPNSVVHLALLGDKLIVTGQAKDIVEETQILSVVSANAPGGTRARAQQSTADEIPIGNINVTAFPDVNGNLPQQGLENFILRDMNRNVVNLLRVPGEQQVMLRVAVAEINRTAARTIGLDLSVLNAAGSTVFATTTAGLIPTTVTGMGTSTTLTSGNAGLIDNGKVALAIEALRNINLARSLSEQNVVAMNGQVARFAAGGDFPVPAATATFGAVGQGVSFIPFGVQMQFVPYITDRDRIRLRVAAVLSTLDPSLGATISAGAGTAGTSVPGLQERTFQTTVELRAGQTFAVAGLNQNTFGATTARVPFFGDLPILGPLAGKNAATQAEQEVVILVTPELVHPLEACGAPPLPGSDVFEPGDVEFYLLNRLESRRSYDNRSSVRTDCPRQKRYEHCDDVFIIGTHGQNYNCCLQGGGCEPAPAAIISPAPGSPDAGHIQMPIPAPMTPTPVPLLPAPAPPQAPPRGAP
jgi:pilus assembly protein CpaC